MAPAWAPKHPVEKLPLAVRKNVREEYEPKKAEYIDVNAVSAYVDISSANIGLLLARYIDAFNYALTIYTQNFEDVGKEYFKNAVTGSRLTVTVNDLGKKADTIDADVKDGVFRILFHFSQFGNNATWLNDPFDRAIDKAPLQGFGLKAKASIETDYNANVEEVQKKIVDNFNLPDVILDPNFEASYAASKKKSDQDWQTSFGSATLE